MNASFTPYLLAIGSNLCFGTASLLFSRFSKSHSPFWINQLKVSVAFIGFVIAFLLVENRIPLSALAAFYLLLSGFLGLCIGDLFLFRAFTTLGAARTLVLFSFQPLLLGAYGFLFLHQNLNLFQCLAILCMIGCVLTFLLERNRLTGHWDFRSFLFAFVGILLDTLGVMLTRQSFEITPGLGSFEVNSVRAIGALLGFIALRPRSYSRLISGLKELSRSDLSLAIGACFFGTFVSLSLYLHALKTAHVATLTAITITGPVWISLIEHGRSRSLPNRYLWIAFCFFLLGFGFMTYGLRS